MYKNNNFLCLLNSTPERTQTLPLRPKLLKIIFGLIMLISSNLAFSASCWRAISIPQSIGQITTIPADCTTIPGGFGWAKVGLSYNGNTPADLYVRISLNDSHVAGWKFEPLLVFSHYDTNGKPVIFTDLLTCVGCNNFVILDHFPPEQGIPQHNDRVRLRYGFNGNCIYSAPQNGAIVRNSNCRDVTPEMIYIVKSTGNGTYRLQQEVNNQCLYALNTNGATAHNWGCWNDPNMRFTFDASNGGFRLHHISTNQCLYGSQHQAGPVYSWVCWNDPNMVYFIDIVN